MTAQDRDEAGVRFPPPFVFLGFVLLGPLLDQFAEIPPLPLSWPMRLIFGTGLIATGLAVALLAIRRFRDAGTRVEPWAPASAIVTDGIYRYTRNPMYVGMTLLSAGLAISMGSVGALITVVAAVLAVDRFVIAKEEAYLQRRFGADYDSYRKSVRRWL